MIVIAIPRAHSVSARTILGVYTLWALLSAEGAALFKERGLAF